MEYIKTESSGDSFTSPSLKTWREDSFWALAEKKLPVKKKMADNIR
jgi:hypothetical protein